MDEESFLTHMGRAGDLIGARRLEEAEVEVLRALGVAAGELRALHVLALVRFKLGRLSDARDVYRDIIAAAPADAGARLHLGLIALKLGAIAEAIDELETAGRLEPNDLRVWSYLGLAYTRGAQTQLAAAAFRRSGQPDLADEVERGDQPATSPQPAAALQLASPTLLPPPPPSPTPVPASDTAAAAPALPGLAPAPGEPLTVGSFAMARLAPSEPTVGTLTSTGGGMVRLQVRDEAYVRADAALASAGTLTWDRGRRRQRGRLTEAWLGADEQPFYRLRGAGDVWLGLPDRTVTALLLEDDILFLREDRVIAFDGDVAWEVGRLPRDGLPLVQFRGRGRVAIELGGDPVAIRLYPERPVSVARTHVLGWIGRVLPRGAGRSWPGGPMEIACEGEGVMLLEGARLS